MKAMILERFGGTERFAVATVPAPVPKRGEVLVTIKAVGAAGSPIPCVGRGR